MNVVFKYDHEKNTLENFRVATDFKDAFDEKWLKEGRMRCGQTADHGSQGALCNVMLRQISESNKRSRSDDQERRN